MTSERRLTGPAVSPKSGGPVRQLIVLLHGIGADGNDLAGLAPYYQSVLPHAHVVAPDAPFPFDMAPFGYMWFSIADMRADTRLRGARTAAPLLDAFIDAELSRLGLDDAALVLAGFSQGAMMALHTGLRRARPPAGIVSHSGMLVGDGVLAQEIACRPPVLLTHGAADEVVPAACLPMADTALRAAGVPVETHLVPGLGHGIDDATLRLALAFLARRFGPQA